nr:MAG TPA: hypothetical protein [Caudoviricetes sp.]DAH86047.1 MAG TPA: hypothetical protein [Caudoviricetes sp.]
MAVCAFMRMLFRIFVDRLFRGLVQPFLIEIDSYVSHRSSPPSVWLTPWDKS